MIYLLLGEDSSEKRKKFNKIRSSCLPSEDALNLDYELLYGLKLDPETLKKALLALPAVAKERLVLIQNAEKLNEHNKEIISSVIRAGHDHIVLVLDVSQSSVKGEFFREMTANAEVFKFGGKEEKKNIWDVTKAIERRKLPDALKTLNALMIDGDPPVKIMGGLVWFWGSLKNRLSADNFKKGLLVLQEADLNIKRSRLRPEYAVEVAVTKLSSLIAC